MGRFPQLPATKGSQKWIQKLVNEKSTLLNSLIKKNLALSEDEVIQWCSPRVDDDYAEYRDNAFLDLLEVKLAKVPLTDFWPKRGPQWDALARSTSGKLFLIEAKSHIPELISSMQADNKNSRERIGSSLNRTKDFLNAKSKFDWSSCFYQYTNRLAHLYLLRELNQLPAYLVFVYFVNDADMHGPKTINEWKSALILLHSCLGLGRHKLDKFITDVFIVVKRFE
jgi:hypothetical protein